MKKSPCLSRAVPAFMVLQVAICNLLDAQTQSKPTPPDETDAFPRSKEGNVIATVVDLLYAAQEVDLQTPFKGGQTVELIGQLMPDTTNDAKGNHFKLLRMFMAEDDEKARPVAVLVESATSPKFAEKAWIKVVGTVEFRAQSGKTIAVVKATKVEAIDPPAQPILF